MRAAAEAVCSILHGALLALDEGSEPVFDKKLGQELADIGAFVGALTPDRLGEYIGSLFA